MGDLAQSILMWIVPCVLVLVGFVLAICGGARFEQNDGRNIGGAGTLEAIGWVIFGAGLLWFAWRLVATIDWYTHIH